MRLVVAAVGRVRGGPLAALFDDYARRSTWPVDLVEVPVGAGDDRDRRRIREAQGLEQAVARARVRIALDETGETLDSAAFAERMRLWRDDGEPCLGFQIGGPDGLDRRILDRADLKLAFGRMTWPHQLVRVMLAEQIWRAASILAGHPYHRS